jgi:hypothetical protein
MKRILSLLVLTTVLLSTAACSEKKPPEVAALQGKNILSVLRNLGGSYEKKNLTSFMSDVSAEYQDREAFSNALAKIFAKYDAIRFNIQYTKMLIVAKEGGRIRATFNWDAEWIAASGASQKNGGRVALVFDAGNFKLVSIDGKNPFLPVAVPVKQ